MATAILCHPPYPLYASVYIQRFCRFLSKKSGGPTPALGVGPPDVNSICFHTPVMDFTIPHTIPPPISLLYCQNEKVNADNCIVRGEYHKDLINTFMI